MVFGAKKLEPLTTCLIDLWKVRGKNKNLFYQGLASPMLYETLLWQSNITSWNKRQIHLKYVQERNKLDLLLIFYPICVRASVKVKNASTLLEYHSYTFSQKSDPEFTICFNIGGCPSIWAFLSSELLTQQSYLYNFLHQRKFLLL